MRLSLLTRNGWLGGRIIRFRLFWLGWRFISFSFQVSLYLPSFLPLCVGGLGLERTCFAPANELGVGPLGLIGLLSCREGVMWMLWMLLVPLGLVLVTWMEIWPGDVLCGLLQNENGIWSLQIVHDSVVSSLKLVLLK
jgi:hypothetical protein